LRMHKSDHQRFSYAATDHDAVSRFLHNISLCKDWILGECVVKEQESPLAIYQATNRDGYPFLLYVSPIRTWGREERIHQHVIRVNRALAQGSFRYNACEPMIQQPTWIRSGDFFFGITPDRGLQSIFKMAPFHNRSSFILNTIHITALFRFLECDIWPFTREAESSEDLLVKATALYDKVAPRLHNASEIPRRWGHFYRHNAETAARTHDFTPVYTVGDFLSECLVYCPERETLYLEGAFSFSPGTRGDDLCDLLYLLRKQSAEDKQYFIDFYFHLNVPNHFFTYLSYKHMSHLLEQIANSAIGSREDQIGRDELRRFSESREGFRTPVPVWYKSS
jgi:hypothetical protein